MRKNLWLGCLVGALMLVLLVAAAPPVPASSPSLLEKELPDILQQLVVIFSVPAVGVMFGNFIKIFPFMKWMDGKTDMVVAFLVTVAFGGAVSLKLFNPDLLGTVMPWLAANFEKYIGYFNTGLGLIISIISVPWFHDKIKGWFIVGRSFNPVKK
jgi:hypothetical protein